MVYTTSCSFYIQVEQEQWHTLCVSITLTWRSQCVNCSQLWTLLIIFVHLLRTAPIKEMFLMLWATSFSLIYLRLICTYCAVYFLIGRKKKWAWYSQMYSSVCLQVFHCIVQQTTRTLPMNGLLVEAPHKKSPYKASGPSVLELILVYDYFYFPLDGMQVLRRVTPSIKFAHTHLYTWVERGTMRIKRLSQEPGQGWTQTARSGVECTNRNATMPFLNSPYSSGDSFLASHFPFQFLAFEFPHPLRMSNDPPWVGVDIFWNHPNQGVEN